jgi:hypothetical protein
LGVHGGLHHVPPIQLKHIGALMTEKPSAPKGRPTIKKMEPIQASAEEIAKAIFRAADRKLAKTKKPKKKVN